MRGLHLAIVAAAVLCAAVGAVAQPQECGVWQGNTQTFLCDASVPCPNTQCGLLTAPVLGAVSKCHCTSCHYDDVAQACSGTCQYTHACTLTAPRTCACTPVPPAPTPAPPAPTPQTPPTPAPPTPCGIYVATTPTDGTPPTTLCDPPTCATTPGQLCGIFAAPGPAPSPAPTCACSNCTYVGAIEQCVGLCPLGYGCSLIAGTTQCTCARQATPAPTPPPPCGLFEGDTKTWLCAAPECAPVTLPGTDILQPRRCGVLERDAAGAPAACACTTCRLDVATQRCLGRCQLNHVCSRSTATGTCVCRRRVSVIIWVLLVATLFVPIVLVFAAMLIF